MKRVFMATLSAGVMLAMSAIAHKAVAEATGGKVSALKGYTYYTDRAGKHRWKILDPRNQRTVLYSTKGYASAGLRNAAAKMASQESCAKSNFRLKMSSSRFYYSLLYIGKGKDKGKALGRVAGNFRNRDTAQARLNQAAALACHK